MVRGQSSLVSLPLSWSCCPVVQVLLAPPFRPVHRLYRPLTAGGPGVATFRGTLPLAAPAGGLSCEGDGQDEQQSTKKNTNMKTNTTNKTGGKALGQSEQFTAPTGVSKYIVILHGGKEQVVTFPFEAKHADVFGYVRQECREAVQAISAGFFISQGDAFWSGGESDSLNLPSRPADRELIQAFLKSADRQAWDLTLLAQAARANF